MASAQVPAICKNVQRRLAIGAAAYLSADFLAEPPSVSGARAKRLPMKISLSDAVQKATALVVFLFLSLQFQSCKDQGVSQTALVSLNHTDVSLKNTDTFRYPTVGGDEEGARITVQAKHYNVSEMRRNAETNWVAVYMYQPTTGYIGTDYAEIEIRTGSDGASSPTSIRTVAFRFVITN